MARLRSFAALVALALLAAHGNAQEPDDKVTRARTHFEAGRALYQLGSYVEARREFAAGYELAPRPQFLLNLGQCDRKLGDLTTARQNYQRYLHDAPPTDPERPQAEQILAEIDQQLADRAAAEAALHAAPSTSAAPSLTPASNALVQSAPPRRSWARRNWWVFPVGAVAVGVAVGLGVYYGTRAADPCSSANLACWDLSR